MQRLGIREVQCFALDHIPEVGGCVNVGRGDGPHRLLPEPLAGVRRSGPILELAGAICSAPYADPGHPRMAWDPSMARHGLGPRMAPNTSACWASAHVR